MFYLNTIEQLFLLVEQLYQLEVCLPYSRLLTGIPTLSVYQNLRWNSNKTSLTWFRPEHPTTTVRVFFFNHWLCDWSDLVKSQKISRTLIVNKNILLISCKNLVSCVLSVWKCQRFMLIKMIKMLIDICKKNCLWFRALISLIGQATMILM